MLSRLFLFLLLAALNAVHAADEKHPVSIAGRWATEVLPTHMLVFEPSGTLKRLRSDEPMADLGYWEQTEDDRISIKMAREEKVTLHFAIDSDTLRLTNPDGDTTVFQRQTAIRPADVLGAWDVLGGESRADFVIVEDGTYEPLPGRISPFGSGTWRWLESGWIEFRSPETEPSQWRVILKDDVLKLVSRDSKIIKCVRVRQESPVLTGSDEAKKPASSSDDQSAELEAMRRIRARLLEEATTRRIEEASNLEKTDPKRAIALLREWVLLVSRSDDLAEETRARLLDQLEQRIREAVVRARGR